MITELSKVKAVLDIQGTEKDAQIEALIPLVEQDYLSIRNKPFDRDDSDNVVYPAGAESTAIRMIEYMLFSKPLAGTAGTVSSESLSRYSVSYVVPTDVYPTHIIASIKRFVEFV